MTNHRDIINRALWAFHPASEKGKLCLELVGALEAILKKQGSGANDEQAVRDGVENWWVNLLIWADILEESGEPVAAVGMRWLARNGKFPGATQGKYRWMAEKAVFGSGASWTLPESACYEIGSKVPAINGRFSTLTAAFLGAARVMGRDEWHLTPSRPDE